MFFGVDHVGIGVRDMEEGVRFFADRFGFSEVYFDYIGDLPGLEELTHRRKTRARVVMLGSRFPTPLGPGRIKLVQVLSDGRTPPLPTGGGWGELGICEVCIHVHDVRAIHNRLVHSLGCRSLMEPLSTTVPPFDIALDLAYVGDPSEGKVELLEWTGIWSGLPAEARLEGVNHVAFGVKDMGTTRAFYERLGFTQLVLESDDYFEPMRSWYPTEMPRQHIVLALPGLGAGIEPVKLHSETIDCRGEWGHCGPMEFAIGVTNLEKACSELRGVGVRLLSDIHRVDVGTGEWGYAYFEDPDGLYVSLVEPRY